MEGLSLDSEAWLCGFFAYLATRALVRSDPQQTTFQFIPNVFSSVQVKALGRPPEFLHTSLGKPCTYILRFVRRGIVMLQQV